MPLPFKKLRRILKRYSVTEDSSRGKGSHTVFFRTVEGNTFSYPIPTHNKEVLDCYVSGIRKKFFLTPDDGISDEEFFG